MTETEPLGPTVPDIETLSPAVSGRLRLIAFGLTAAFLSAEPTLPAPRSMLWDGHEFDCEDASWHFSAGSLQLHIRKHKFEREKKLGAMFGVLNRPAEFQLKNGDILTARLATLVGRSDTVNLAEQSASTTYCLQLDSWTWWPSAPQRFWVGQLIGIPELDDGNLVVSAGERWTASNMRLCGKFDLYVQQSRDSKTATLLIDTHGQKLEHDVLGTDFLAMEFAFGKSLQLNKVAAIDSSHQIVGIAAPEFGRGIDADRIGRCPTAGSRDLYASHAEIEPQSHFVPVFFSLVSRLLHEEGIDSTLTTAVAAYLDSLAIMNVHVAYLVAQVALEAFCSGMVQQSAGVLVRDARAWAEYVKSHESEIRAFAIEEKAAEKLVNKVISAQQAPSSDRVASALQSLELNVPRGVLAEVKQRNPSAHRLVMARESTADPQDLADRLATIQTLLVAVIAKHVGFTGPIVGWEWVRGRRKVPDWWHWERAEEAKRHFATDNDNGRAIDDDAPGVSSDARPPQDAPSRQ